MRLYHHPKTTAVFLFTALTLFAFSSLQAVEHWVGPTGNDDSWFTGTNWNNGAQPGAAENAFIDNFGVAQVNAPMAHAGKLSIGTGFNDGGTLRVGQTGTLTIQGNLLVADDGIATGVFHGTGQVTDNNGIIGNDVDGDGTVTVKDSAIWTNNNNLWVGNAGGPGVGGGNLGQGTLNIQDMGQVSAATLVVGRQAGSQGTVDVKGTFTFGVPPFNLTSTGDTSIGQSGDGTMKIHDGGEVLTDGNAFIGDNSTGTGMVTVRDVNSLWSIGGNLDVGRNGVGTLEIHNSGYVFFFGGGNLRIGRNGGSTGAVVVEGAGSTLDLLGGNVFVAGDNGGSGGDGSLKIINGGLVDHVHNMTVWGAGPGNTGPGLLVVDSTYTLNVSGTLRFDGGILRFLDDTTFINPALLTGAGVFVDTNDTTSTISGLLSGTGGLTKRDTGTLFLSNDNTYTGDTVVANGSLYITGSVAGDARVQNGTTLGGIDDGVAPNVGGDLFVHGTLTPGVMDGQAALFTVGGNYTNHADGTYVTEIGGLTPGVTADNVSANTANIQGGTLRVVNLNNFQPFLNDRVSVVSTTNGLTGGYATLDPVGWIGLIQPFEDDTANTVDVVFLLAASFASQGHTPNQIATGKALDAAAAADCIPDAIRFLGNISPIGPVLRSDYDLIAAEELASMYEVTFSSSTVQTQNLQRRMNDIRDGSFGFCADGFAIRDDHGLAKSDGKGSKEVIEQVAPPSDRWGVFITGTGDLVRTSGTYNADGYQLNQGGFTIGADYRVTHNFAIGIDGGFTETRGDLNNNGRLDVDSGKIGIYATFFTDGGFYVDGTASGGWNNFGTRRSALLGQEHGATDGAEFNGSIAAGYDWKRGCWKFGPIASFEYDYAQFNSFTESDSSLIPLHFPDQNQDAERSNVGLHISHQQNYKGNGCNVISEVRAYWRHDYGDNAYAIDSNFVGCDDVFTVHGPEMGRDSALIDAGLTIMCTRHLDAYFYYDGQYGRDNYYVNAVSGGLRLNF